MYKIIRPILFQLDPEKAHEAAIWLGKSLWSRPFSWLYHYEHECLRTNVCGIDFTNPVGLAAGFDKNAELVDFLPALGFGFLEVGSVTAKPSAGNPRPRLFRIPAEEALVNKMGLNNIGAGEMLGRLQGRKFSFPLGINIAKTNDSTIMGDKAIEDMCYTIQKISPVADYITLNISCPNTKDGKTCEDSDQLEELLAAITPGKPLFIKISPTLSYKMLDGILSVAENYGVNGYVLSNTITHSDGGLSGKPLREKATKIIQYVYSHLDHPTIIGVGGIFSAEDAYEKIKAGASLIQVYTGLIYEGPGLVKKIKKGLVTLLERDGFSSVREAVGSYTESTGE